MHSRIFEISKNPVKKDERFTSSMVPDWFVGPIADYVIDIQDNYRVHELEWFMDMMGSSAERKCDELILSENAIDAVLNKQYVTFTKYADKLSKTSIEQFYGNENFGGLIRDMFILNDAFEDKFGFYIYDKEADQMVTLGTWIRFAETGQKYYFGGIVDYHY